MILRWSPEFPPSFPALGWYAMGSAFAEVRLRPDWIFDDEQKGVWVPFWMADLAVAATLGLWWWRGRQRPGFCPCGYPVTRGSSAVCPECGRSLTERVSHPPGKGSS